MSKRLHCFNELNFNVRFCITKAKTKQKTVEKDQKSVGKDGKKYIKVVALQTQIISLTFPAEHNVTLTTTTKYLELKT